MAASMARRLLLLLALLSLLGEASADVGAGASLEDDVLLPYPRGRARLARDCARVRAGRREHESWPATPGARDPDVHTFVSHFGDRAVAGHLTRVADPLRTFSVLEPGGPGGCATRRRATVEDTARPAGCLVAQNGGFFGTETNECLGNVVSDGRRVSSAGGLQNAQFGIRRDGTLVTGYLSEEEVLDTENPFVQLVSGVVWLIRNGSVYINESQATECEETQETGSFSKFVNVISARTAVGHDREGRLVLFHADGQTEQRGINLWEMADFLLRQDVVNAINLDGGGSATFVANGSLASYPSDHCQTNSMWRCARRVATVVCVHAPRCQPPDCNGHGTCVSGRCQCTGRFWRGDACDQLDCGPANCSGHGLCTETGCHCDAGWTGPSCDEAEGVPAAPRGHPPDRSPPAAHRERLAGPHPGPGLPPAGQHGGQRGPGAGPQSAAQPAPGRRLLLPPAAGGERGPAGCRQGAARGRPEPVPGLTARPLPAPAALGGWSPRWPASAGPRPSGAPAARAQPARGPHRAATALQRPWRR